MWPVSVTNGELLLVILLQMWILVRIVQDKNNLVIWADYVSTRGTDGKQHGDLDKLGQLAGIGLTVVTIFMYADNEKVEPLGLSALLGVGLAYLGAVKAYSSYLRAKNGGSTPPLAAPAPVAPAEVPK